MKKRIFSLILVLCLVMSLFAGCGSKDKKKGDKNSDEPDVETAQGTIEKIASIKDGTFETGMKIEVPGANLDYVITSKVSGEDCAVGIKMTGTAQGQNVNINLPDVLILANKMVYFDLNAIKKLIVDNASIAGEEGEQFVDMLKDVNLGWFRIPLPDDMSTTNTASSDVKKSVEKLLKDILATGKEDGTTVTFDSADQIKAAMNVVAVFFETDMVKIMQEVGKMETSTIDMNKYFQKILDTYYDELVEAMESLEMDKSMIDTYVDQIKGQDLNAMMKDFMENSAPAELPDDTELAGIARDIRKAADSVTDVPGSVKIATSANGNTYRADVALDITEGGQTVKGTIWYQATEGGASISAPTNVLKLKDIVDQLFEVVMSVAGGQ